MEQLVAALFFFLAWWDVGFSFFFFLPLEPLALGKAGKKKGTGKKKGDKEQNNSIRMLLDLFFFPLEICPLQRGGESSGYHRIPHEISRGSTRF